MLFRRFPSFLSALRAAKVALLSGLVSAYGTGARAACLSVPADAAPPPVTFCDTESSYAFNIAGTTFAYDKASFREQLRTAFAAWFAASDLAPPRRGRIEFWLAVPEIDPGATQARAVLTWDGGTLVAYLGLHPEGWHLSSKSIGILAAGDSYPGNFGFTPESLLIEDATAAASAEVAAYLEPYGATLPETVGGRWQVYRVPALQEASIAAQILADPNHGQWVSQVTLNAVVEWIATRQRAFAFSFGNP